MLAATSVAVVAPTTTTTVTTGTTTTTTGHHHNHLKEQQDDHHPHPPSSSYFQSYIWPGLGLFGESYLLFSVGTLQPLWLILYPQCFPDDDSNEYEYDDDADNNNNCPATRIHALTYSVVFGVILGMTAIGLLSNTIGRRNGSLLTASLMGGCSLAMTLLLTMEGRLRPGRLFFWLGVLMFGFGLGVGGEYPLSASTASENAMEDLKVRREMEEETTAETNAATMTTTACGDRGKRIILVFSMQGVGVFVQSLVLTLLLFITGQTGRASKNSDNDDGNENYDNDQYYAEYEYDNQVLLTIWKIVYAIASIVLIYVLLSRYYHLEESKVWADDRRRQMEEMGVNLRDSTTGEYTAPQHDDVMNGSATTVLNETDISDSKNDGRPGRARNDNDGRTTTDFVSGTTRLLLQQYGMRLFGTSMTWLLWDVAFYGNKLFQASFILALTGEDTTLFELSAAATLNALIALLGYYAAAHLVDRPFIGRRLLQQYGFLATGTLFSLCALLQNNNSPTLLLSLYLLSSFFGQCGPNCTTFLLPAEIFPTEVRTACHGLSASAGKLGALIAATTFHKLDQNNQAGLFWICGVCSFLAAGITFCCIPDTTTLDLYELDREWRMVVDGRDGEYVGPAVDVQHLSFWERRRRSNIGKGGGEKDFKLMGSGVHV